MTIIDPITLRNLEKIIRAAEHFKHCYSWEYDPPYSPPISEYAREEYEGQWSVPLIAWMDQDDVYIAQFHVQMLEDGWVIAFGDYIRNGEESSFTTIKNSYKRLLQTQSEQELAASETALPMLSDVIKIKQIKDIIDTTRYFWGYENWDCDQIIPSGYHARKLYELWNSKPLVKWTEGGDEYTARIDVKAPSDHKITVERFFTCNGAEIPFAEVVNSYERILAAAPKLLDFVEAIFL